VDEVVVGALHGVEARMRVVVHRQDVKNGDVRWQIAVEARQEVEIVRVFQVGVKKILAGVHLCICTATAIDAHRRFQHFAEHPFDDFLHADSRLLPLPAVVLQSVEGDMEKEPFDVCI